MNRRMKAGSLVAAALLAGGLTVTTTNPAAAVSGDCREINSRTHQCVIDDLPTHPNTVCYTAPYNFFLAKWYDTKRERTTLVKQLRTAASQYRLKTFDAKRVLVSCVVT